MEQNGSKPSSFRKNTLLPGIGFECGFVGDHDVPSFHVYQLVLLQAAKRARYDLPGGSV